MKPIEVTVVIDLDAYLSEIETLSNGDSIGHPTLEEVVLERTAQLLVEKVLGAKPEWMSGFEQDLRTIRNEEIKAQVRPLIEAALGREMVPTDDWGNPQGPRTTLTELITKKVKECLAPKASSRMGGSPSLIESLINTEVERVLRGELQAELLKAKGQVIAAVQEQGSKVLAETITRMASS